MTVDFPFLRVVRVSLLALLWPLSAFAQGEADSLRQALASAETDTARAATLYRLGRATRSSDPAQAKSYYLRAADLARRCNSPARRAKAMEGVARLAYGQRAFDTALRYFDLASKYAGQAGDRSAEAGNLSNGALVLEIKGETQQAIDRYLRAVEIFQSLDSVVQVAGCLANLGTAYETMGLYVKASDMHYRALAIRDSLGDERGKAVCYNNLANVYSLRDEQDKALGMYRKALKTFSEVGFDRGMASCLTNMGVIHRKLGLYGPALEYLDSAGRIEKRSENLYGLAASYFHMAHVYREMGRYEEAVDHFLLSLSLNRRIGHMAGQASDLVSLAGAYVELGWVNKARASVKEGLSIARKGRYQHTAMDALRLLAEIHALSGEHRAAYEAHVRYLAARDSVTDEEKAQAVGRIEARYEYEREQAAEARAKAEAEAERRRREVIEFSGIALFILAVFVVVFYLAFSGTRMQKRLFSALIFLSFLLLFEFVLVMTDPVFDAWASKGPLFKLTVNFSLAMVFVPLHQFLEARFKARVARLEDEEQAEKRRKQRQGGA